jgi:hypothetical protein
MGGIAYAVEVQDRPQGRPVLTVAKALMLIQDNKLNVNSKTQTDPAQRRQVPQDACRSRTH